MAVQIQLRRGTAAQWSANSSVVLASGEFAIELDTNRFKIGNGTAPWSALPYSSLPSSALASTVFTAKGSLVSASAAGIATEVTVGANNSLLVADSTTTSGIKWATTLAGLTLTSPTLNTPTLNSPSTTNGTSTNENQTNPIFLGQRETWNLSATAPTGTVTVSARTAVLWYFTTASTANWTFNFRGDGSNTLNSFLAVNQSVTVIAVVTNGSVGYYPTAFQIDGNAVTPTWASGVAPTAGTVNNIDVYEFMIVKTSATPTYSIVASQLGASPPAVGSTLFLFQNYR